MYLSKVSMIRSSQSAQELLKIGTNGNYASHQILWRLFSGEQERTFLYREEIGPDGLPQYFVLSQREPAQNELVFSVQTKPYRPLLNAGDRLAFRLRVNPTVSVKNDTGKSQKHDVLMHAKHQAKKQGIKSGTELKCLMEDAARSWISDERRLLAWGISLDFIPEVERYTQHMSSKAKSQKIRFSSVDFEGVLTVVEPTIFLSRLVCGFGRAKSLGCGLMLIRKI